MARRLFSSVVIAAVAFVAAVTVMARSPQAPAQQAAQEDEFLKGVYVLGHLPGVAPPRGVTAPILKARVFPRYTADAMRAKIQGQVQVQVVVRADGSVARARVTKSLDKVYGLDDAAIAAAMQSAFEPGLLNGEKVAMAVLIDLEFRLH